MAEMALEAPEILEGGAAEGGAAEGGGKSKGYGKQFFAKGKQAGGQVWGNASDVGGMSAAEIYMIAVVIFVLGVWAKGGVDAKAAPLKNVCLAVFGMFVFILMDQGKAALPARLLAWLVFTVAVLTAISNGLLKAVLAPATSAAPATPAAPAAAAGQPVNLASVNPGGPAVNVTPTPTGAPAVTTQLTGGT